MRRWLGVSLVNASHRSLKDDISALRCGYSLGARGSLACSGGSSACDAADFISVPIVADAVA